MRALDQIAQEIAQEAIATAHAAGYVSEFGIRAESPVYLLEDEILHWLRCYMRPDPVRIALFTPPSEGATI